MAFTTKELSSRTLPDFEKVAAKQGGCWCVYYQRERPVKTKSSAEWSKVNLKDKRAFVAAGRSHSIIVYDGPTPIGWCQYGPHDELPRIDARRTYKQAPKPGPGRLWRITCFFVDRRYRGRGVPRIALRAALASIRGRGGGVVEGYPVVSPKMLAVPEWRWFGTVGLFRRAGFKKVAPLGTSAVLMRKNVAG